MAPAHMMHGSTVTYSVQLLQVFAAERRGGGRQGLHLGVGRGVGQSVSTRLWPRPIDRAAGHDDRADGHLL